MSEIAEKKFPYDTEKECKDEFTRKLRNGIIDLLRQSFDLGMEHKEKELMKNAVDGPYIRRNRYTKKNVLNGLDLTCDELQGFKDGQKLKVIFVPVDNK